MHIAGHMPPSSMLRKKSSHPLPDKNNPGCNRDGCTTSIENRRLSFERWNYYTHSESAELFCPNSPVVVLQNSSTDHAAYNAHWESHFSNRSSACADVS